MLTKALAKGERLYRAALFPYTPASLKLKAIFIHIPKAAGTAIRVALGEPATGRHHLPWWVYQQASPRRFEEFYKFAFVRDPLDRAVSGYNYLKSGGNQAHDLSVAKHLERYNDFNEFVYYEITNGNMICHPIFRPQSWYLCDWRGDIQVDYLGRFESLATDFKNVVNALALQAYTELPVANKSPSSSGLEQISEEAKNTISEVYCADYKIFGYANQTTSREL